VIKHKHQVYLFTR